MEYLKASASLLFLIGSIILIFAVPYFVVALAVVGVIITAVGAALGYFGIVSSTIDDLQNRGGAHDQGP